MKKDELLKMYSAIKDNSELFVLEAGRKRKLYKKRYEQKIDAVAAMLDAYIAYKANKDAFE